MLSSLHSQGFADGGELVDAADHERVFREEHLRRTTGADGGRHPMATLRMGVPGRADDYAPELDYMGVDYGERNKFGERRYGMPDGDALEVATTAHQVALESWFGKEMLGELARRDPRMLDLLLGVLFRYDP